MTKNDFLDKLRLALSGKVSTALVRENIDYYSQYIDSQISMGQSEPEVMEMLGDPRLIARTIIQTNGTETYEENAYREEPAYDDTAYSSEIYGQEAYNRNYGNYSNTGREVKVRTIPGWLWTIIVVLLAVCLISFIFSVVSFLLPIVLPVLIVLFLIKLFRDWLN